MRRWIAVVLIVLAVLWIVLNNIGSSMALADFTARPILALTRGDDRVVVQQPGQPAEPAMARNAGGQGISFGYSFAFALPDGTQVTCTHRFRSVTCDGGWLPERAPASEG